jgi:hypothetical protein
VGLSHLDLCSLLRAASLHAGPAGCFAREFFLNFFKFFFFARCCVLLRCMLAPQVASRRFFKALLKLFLRLYSGIFATACRFAARWSGRLLYSRFFFNFFLLAAACRCYARF